MNVILTKMKTLANMTLPLKNQICGPSGWSSMYVLLIPSGTAYLKGHEEILTGGIPYAYIRRDLGAVFAILRGDIPIKPAIKCEAQEKLWKICLQCWNSSPRGRLTVSGACAQINLLSSKCSLTPLGFQFPKESIPLQNYSASFNSSRSLTTRGSQAQTPPGGRRAVGARRPNPCSGCRLQKQKVRHVFSTKYLCMTAYL